MMEENLNPHDVYIFVNTHCVHPNENIAAFCNYEADNMGHYVMTSVVHDRDYDHFSNVRQYGLRSVINDNVNEAIQNIYSVSDDEFHHDVYDAVSNDSGNFIDILYWQLYWYHVNVLVHVENILHDARLRHVNYVDFQLSSDGDKYVLRLIKGINV